MHIPSEMLSTTLCPITATVAVAGVVASGFALYKSKANTPSTLLFALVTATVFGLQMLNYAIFDGVSGHLIGGVFASTLLGIPSAIISLSIVLLVQTLIFADGGILMLCANILNMAIIGAGLGGLIRAMLLSKGMNNNIAIFVASAMSVVLASLAVSLELLASGKGGAEMVATLVGVHTILGLIEGVATIVLVKLVAFESTGMMSKRLALSLCGLIIFSICVSPFASAFPDAFEWTMAKFNLLTDAPNFVLAPFADYTIESISNAFLSSLLAGIVGVFAIFNFSYAISFLFEKIITIKAYR